MPVLTKINTNSIAEDAITGDKFAGDAYLANTANQNISGTYSENRLYTSDAYTLSGNATVNSHLTLSSIKPTDDVVLTAGGAYTITGTGVLSAGSLLAKERTDLTGMTGELGSVVTGSPAITGLGTVTSGTLGSGVTFPAGHVIQTVQEQESGGNSSVLTSTTSLTKVNSSGDLNWKATIRNVAASSWVLVTVSCAVLVYRTSSPDASGGIGIIRNNAGSDVVIYNPDVDSLYYRSGDSTTREYKIQTGISVIDKSPDTGDNTYYLAYKTQAASNYNIMIDSGGNTPTTFVLQEISQ